MAKKYKCKVCKGPFEKIYNTTQRTCSPLCAIEDGRKVKDKEYKAETVKRKKKLLDNDRGFQLKKAQDVFNRFIRLRDMLEPCISCQRHHSGQYHAGHYRTVGANPELRFNEDNCHKQCSACNNHLSGNIANYRINLLVKIGAERLDKLEGPHEAAKLSIDDIKSVRDEYLTKIKEIESNT
jgi:hypothetical protein